MTFWTIVFGSMVGFLLWDILVAVIKVGTRTIKDRMKDKTRKIGFGDTGDSEKKTKSVPQMRKIGFGEND